MATDLATFLSKRNVCAPSVAWARNYTGPVNEAVVAAGSIEWAFLLLMLAVTTEALTPEAAAAAATTALAEVRVPSMRLRCARVRASLAAVSEAGNATAKRSRALTAIRDCGNACQETATPESTRRVCEIVQAAIPMDTLLA